MELERLRGLLAGPKEPATYVLSLLSLLGWAEAPGPLLFESRSEGSGVARLGTEARVLCR